MVDLRSSLQGGKSKGRRLSRMGTMDPKLRGSGQPGASMLGATPEGLATADSTNVTQFNIGDIAVRNIVLVVVI